MDSCEDKLQFEAAALLIEIVDLKGVTQKIVQNVISRVNLMFESFLAVLLVSTLWFSSTAFDRDFLISYLFWTQG